MTLMMGGIGLRIGEQKMIDGVTLTLARGRMNVLLGATLAGKTTLMRLMAGLSGGCCWIQRRRKIFWRRGVPNVTEASDYF